MFVTPIVLKHRGIVVRCIEGAGVCHAQVKAEPETFKLMLPAAALGESPTAQMDCGGLEATVIRARKEENEMVKEGKQGTATWQRLTSEIATRVPTARAGFGVRTRSAKSSIQLNLNLQLRFRFGNSMNLNPEPGVQFGSSTRNGEEDEEADSPPTLFEDPESPDYEHEMEGEEEDEQGGLHSTYTQAEEEREAEDGEAEFEDHDVPAPRPWYKPSIPVLLALAPPIGNRLTGGDHLKDLLLLLLLIFYLHQLVEGVLL
ncbi:hypothetical protein K438DRAFT_1755540 [Mycena galopus ATCC 62051]|nr:hypothetical protein K438DRAFT_1755540 [Mycena galopus ATCC 62051]